MGHGGLRARVAQQPAYASELVDVLMAVGRDDEAWQEALRHRRWFGGSQWQTLLQRRAVTYPAGVIQPYRDLVEQAILNSANKRRYRRAVALLSALQAAYQADGLPAAFPPYLAELRVEHKRRPTFLKTLDAAGLLLTGLPTPIWWSRQLHHGGGPPPGTGEGTGRQFRGRVGRGTTVVANEHGNRERTHA